VKQTRRPSTVTAGQLPPLQVATRAALALASAAPPPLPAAAAQSAHYDHASPDRRRRAYRPRAEAGGRPRAPVLIVHTPQPHGRWSSNWSADFNRLGAGPGCRSHSWPFTRQGELGIVGQAIGGSVPMRGWAARPWPRTRGGLCGWLTSWRGGQNWGARRHAGEAAGSAGVHAARCRSTPARLPRPLAWPLRRPPARPFRPRRPRGQAAHRGQLDRCPVPARPGAIPASRQL